MPILSMTLVMCLMAGEGQPPSLSVSAKNDVVVLHLMDLPPGESGVFHIKSSSSEPGHFFPFIASANGEASFEASVSRDVRELGEFRLRAFWELHRAPHASSLAIRWDGDEVNVKGGNGQVTGVVTRAEPRRVNQGNVLVGPPRLSDARVTLFQNDLSFFEERRTDSSGRFLFDSVPPGTYRLGVCKRDFEYKESEINVPTGSVAVNVVLGPDEHPGRWSFIGDTSPEFLDASNQGTLLLDGRIFFCHDTREGVIFDPRTGDKTPSADSLDHQGCSATSLLTNGKVLFVGGQDSDDFRDATIRVKTYDPATDTWEILPSLNEQRWYPGLVRFADESMLAMGGGQRPNAGRTDTCEIFDPLGQTWTLRQPMGVPCEYPPSVLLLDGRVLRTWFPPQLYDPVANTWKDTGNFNQQTRLFPGHSDHSLMLLEDGRALAIGINNAQGPGRVIGEIYDPATEQWTLTSANETARFQTEVIPLPNGRVLVSGGDLGLDDPAIPNRLGVVKLCDIYEPVKDSWRSVATMNEFREYHATTLLVPDGRVITTGGTNIKFTGATSTLVEAYEPPYLFRGVRPTIDSISQTDLTRGSTVTVDISPATAVTDIVMIGTQAVTHWIDSGVDRFVNIPFTQSGEELSLQIPSAPLTLPLGAYLLFVMVDDIPSEAVIVRVVG